MPFPRAQNRHHADHRHPRLSGLIEIRRCAFRSEPLQINPGGERGDASIRKMKDFLEMVRDFVAGGQDMIRHRGKCMTADSGIRIIDVNVTVRMISGTRASLPANPNSQPSRELCGFKT